MIQYAPTHQCYQLLQMSSICIFKCQTSHILLQITTYITLTYTIAVFFLGITSKPDLGHSAFYPIYCQDLCVTIAGVWIGK
jgi:hypothetical protein